MKITDMLAGALAKAIAFLPNLFAALLIVAVGLIVAAILGRVATGVMRAIGLDRRQAVLSAVGHERNLVQLPGAVGKVVFWSLALVTVGLAVDSLRLPWLSAGVARVLAYLPSVLAAAIIVLVG